MKERKEMRVKEKLERKGRYVEAKLERAKESKQNLRLPMTRRLYFGRNW